MWGYTGEEGDAWCTDEKTMNACHTTDFVKTVRTNMRDAPEGAHRIDARRMIMVIPWCATDFAVTPAFA
jgi:hypothetical protein